MNTGEFIKIAKSAREPKFSELIDLKPLPMTAVLIDFCTQLHPGADKTSQDNECQVFSKAGHYIYKMYSGCFVRTDVNKGKRKMYIHNFKATA